MKFYHLFFIVFLSFLNIQQGHSCTPTLTEYYSCNALNEWTTSPAGIADSVTGCAAPPAGTNWSAIVRHNWLNPTFAPNDTVANISQLAFHTGASWGSLPSSLPEEIIIQSGGKVVSQGNPGVNGTDLCIESGGFFGFNGNITFENAPNRFNSLNNEGEFIANGNFAIMTPVTSTGTSCQRGNISITGAGLLNGYPGPIVPADFNDTRFQTSNCFGPNTTLPVMLLEFKGEKISTGHLLSWTTGLEINNDFFSLELSYDGINFFEITKIKGAGNSTQVQNYNFVNPNISSNTYFYYRLKQVDYDGKFSYSQTVLIEEEWDFEIIQHGTTNEFTFMSPQKGTYLIQIHNTLGQLVYAQNLNVNQELNISIPITSGSGVYFIQASLLNSPIRQNKKIIINN